MPPYSTSHFKTRSLPKRQPLNTRLAGVKRDERYKAYLNHPAHDPYPTNPFRSFRLAHNLGVGETADLIGISKQAYIRTEQGMFTEPPDAIVKWFSHKWTLSERDLIADYEDFQLEVRSRHHRLFGDMGFALLGTVHPLIRLLSSWEDPDGVPLGSMNVTECAKLLCLSQPLLNNWLKHDKKQVIVPVPFTNALLQSGYSKHEIDLLRLAYSDYRQ